MRNSVLLGILILTFAGLAAAQSASSSPDAQAPANLPWDMSALTGCLTQKMGQYTLIDEEGTSHDLVGTVWGFRCGDPSNPQSLVPTLGRCETRSCVCVSP